MVAVSSREHPENDFKHIVLCFCAMMSFVACRNDVTSNSCKISSLAFRSDPARDRLLPLAFARGLTRATKEHT